MLSTLTHETTFPKSRLVCRTSALKHNLSVIQDRIQNATVIAMVKANAYGHGAVQTAQHLREIGIRAFGVATLDEALELRSHFKFDKIILWAGAFAKDFEILVENKITPVLHSLDLWNEWIRLTRERKVINYPVHLEVDTGIVRSGLTPAEHEEIVSNGVPPHVYLEALGSHFSSSETMDGTSLEQKQRFRSVWELYERKGLKKPLIHISNSGGIIQSLVEPHETWVRPGIMIYGYSPVKEYQNLLKPLGTFQAQIIDIKRIPKGQGVSYNHTFVAPRETVVATIGAGYADGIPRVLSNRMKVDIHGISVPAIGTICMDLSCLDITDCQDKVRLGDWVTLFGENGEALRWAESTGTIVYEILCRMGTRVHREWVEA